MVSILLTSVCRCVKFHLLHLKSCIKLKIFMTTELLVDIFYSCKIAKSVRNIEVMVFHVCACIATILQTEHACVTRSGVVVVEVLLILCDPLKHSRQSKSFKLFMWACLL